MNTTGSTGNASLQHAHPAAAVDKKKRGFKIRKLPTFFALISLTSFIFTLGFSFAVLFSYSTSTWAPFVGMGVLIVSTSLARITVSRHTPKKNAGIRKTPASELLNELVQKKEITTETQTSSSPHVFDAQDLQRNSPFTLEQLREVALEVAAENEDREESTQWTPIDVPKPLYAEIPKTQWRPIPMVEKTDREAEAVDKNKNVEDHAADEKQEGSASPESSENQTEAQEKKKEAGEAITNLDDVLQRRRAF